MLEENLEYLLDENLGFMVCHCPRRKTAGMMFEGLLRSNQ